MKTFPRYAVVVLVAMATATTASAGVAAAPDRGVVYAGELPANGGLVIAGLNPVRSRIARLSYNWEAQCIPGPAATPETPPSTFWTDGATNLPINARGGWSDRETFRRLWNGVNQEFVYRIAGVRSSVAVTGTIQVTLLERDLAGTEIRRCASRPVRFVARQRGTYGGRTIGQRNLIMIRTNPAGTRIERLRWDWETTCTLGPGATPETRAGHFEQDYIPGAVPIVRDRFLRDLRYDPVSDQASGLTRQYHAKVVGQRVAGRLRGTLTAGFSEWHTQTGAVVRTCRRTVKFNIAA